MAKIPFNMSKNEQYVECHRPFRLPNGEYSGMIRIYELLNPAKQNMLTTMDWSFDPIILDPKAATGYNSLEIDGQLVNLEKLVQDLCKSRLRVNKLGYCYFQILQGVADTTETYGFAFYRLHDKLKWSDYGVSVKLDKQDVRPLWDQLDILHGKTLDVKEIHQKDNHDTANEQQKPQIQKLTVRVKEVEARLHQYTSAASPALFHIKRQRDYPQTSQTVVQSWEIKSHNFDSYTPTFVRMTTGESYKKLSFQMQQGQEFDTSNWYFVKVKEVSTPILVYEGTMHSVNVAGHTVSSPIDGSAYILHKWQFWFRPVILVGLGPRIGIWQP